MGASFENGISIEAYIDRISVLSIVIIFCLHINSGVRYLGLVTSKIDNLI